MNVAIEYKLIIKINAYILMILAFLTLTHSCIQSAAEKDDTTTILFKDFDLFQLRGKDTIKDRNGKESVSVKYSSQQIPIAIKYKLKKRSVSILFEDSVYDNKNRRIYIYSTSNLFGGPPGRHRVYTGHTEEYKDFLYIDLSDTLLCQIENVPKDNNFSFHLFAKNVNGSLRKISKGEFDYDDVNKGLTKGELYSKWFYTLKKELDKDTSSPIIINKLPGP